MAPRTILGVIFRPQQPPERLRPTAEACEASGVDELWLWEDCFAEAGVSAAAAALACTERLHVGIGVLPVPLRNPALAAMEIATLARMFPGRVHVGLGHGVLDWMGQVGARAASPLTLLREYVVAVQELLSGRTVSTEGRYVRLTDVTLAWPPEPKPALHVAAVGPKTVALAGELGDGLVLTSGTSVAQVAAARAAFDAARASPPAGGGRPGRGRVTTYLMAVHGERSAERYRAELDHWRLGDLDAAEIGVHGGPDEIAAAVRRWAAAGSDAVVLQPTADDDPAEYARFAGERVRELV